MTVGTALALVAAVAIGFAVAVATGFALGWHFHSARSSTELARLRERLAAIAENEETLGRALGLLGEDSARRHSRAIGTEVASLVGPLRDAVDALSDHVDHVERDRLHAYAGLSAQVADMHRASQLLAAQAGQLVTALRAPQVRGRWGEIQLERVVELAGMSRHCDFDTQVSATGVRPDLVVRLAGGKQIVVDAKVPLTAFLDAATDHAATDHAATDHDPEATERHLMRHARHLRTHVDHLADKRYWHSFEPSPEFVVLFVPGDPFLDAALTRDRGLLEHAFGRGVILATPTTLIALLRTVAYTWKQDALARDAATIRTLGRELFERLGTVGAHVDRLGIQLAKAVESYNSTVGSLESRVFVTAHKLHDLDLFEGDAPDITRIDARPRSVARASDSSTTGRADDATGC